MGFGHAKPGWCQGNHYPGHVKARAKVLIRKVSQFLVWRLGFRMDKSLLAKGQAG